MSLNRIYEEVKAEQVDWSRHAVEKMFQSGLSSDQVFETILRGTVRKKESDEESGGRYNKYTITWKGRLVVVKDSQPARIITVGRQG
jgi:hypothetical protein